VDPPLVAETEHTVAERDPINRLMPAARSHHHHHYPPRSARRRGASHHCTYSHRCDHSHVFIAFTPTRKSRLHVATSEPSSRL